MAFFSMLFSLHLWLQGPQSFCDTFRNGLLDHQSCRGSSTQLVMVVLPSKPTTATQIATRKQRLPSHPHDKFPFTLFIFWKSTTFFAYKIVKHIGKHIGQFNDEIHSTSAPPPAASASKSGAAAASKTSIFWDLFFKPFTKIVRFF